MYNKAIASFARAYVDAYYDSDASLQADFELQQWAKASNTIPHIRDFPTAFKTKAELTELLTHLIFTGTIHHHAMNGAVTWHRLSVPHSSTALLKPLPTAKLQSGQKLGLREYSLPTPLVPLALPMQAGFLRRVPFSESLFNAYTVEPFVSEPLLQPALHAFEAAPKTIDGIMLSREARSAWPFLLMRRKDLPFFIWL